jgi:hypothetical protein
MKLIKQNVKLRKMWCGLGNADESVAACHPRIELAYVYFAFEVYINRPQERLIQAAAVVNNQKAGADSVSACIPVTGGADHRKISWRASL